MSTAEWNVLGLLLNLGGMLLLFRHGLPGRTSRSLLGWIGFAALIAGTACQIWANLRWVG